MATMTRQHFQHIADVLKDTRPDATNLPERDQWQAMVDAFARSLCRTNPNFNPSKFRAAAGAE